MTLNELKKQMKFYKIYLNITMGIMVWVYLWIAYNGIKGNFIAAVLIFIAGFLGVYCIESIEKKMALTDEMILKV